MSPPQTKKEKDLCTRPCHKSGDSTDYIVQPNGKAHDIYVKAPRVSINDLIQTLQSFGEEEFTSEKVAQFLKENPVELESIKGYCFFDTCCYTRNRVTINDRFEVMLLCWQQGQATPIHNHDGRSCWVYVLSGALAFTNYKYLGCDRKERTTHLEEKNRVPLAAEGSLNVIDERDTIHRLSNEPNFSDRSISLHVYAKPLSTVVVYDMASGRCRDESVEYYSIDGIRQMMVSNSPAVY